MRSIRALQAKDYKEACVKNFWYLFAAYTIIWTALCMYMMRLSRKNKELAEEVHALQAQVAKVVTE